MILFLLSNAAFLASFVWLQLGGASLLLWAGWVCAWIAADYAVIWITGYEPPNWAWGVVLAMLAALWSVLASGTVGV